MYPYIVQHSPEAERPSILSAPRQHKALLCDVPPLRFPTAHANPSYPRTRKDSWIAVFDILGFKELIRQTDRDFPRELLTERLEELIGVLDSRPSEGGVEHLILSDTFVIWTPDLEPRSYPWFLRKCKDLITRSIYIELPIRGAISVGPVFFSTNPLARISHKVSEESER
jgi:hypothetical protein